MLDDNDEYIRKIYHEFPEYESIIKKLFSDYPSYNNNVFIIMRFNLTEQFQEISKSIIDGLSKYGLFGLRADNKSYSEDLWANVCGYMLACKYGIAVFEDIDDRNFNPNVALEYGFMVARKKPVLLLKEQRMPKIPTDITGKLWKPFSIFNIKNSIKEQIDSWAIDIGVSRVDNYNPYDIPPIIHAKSLKNGLLIEIDREIKNKTITAASYKEIYKEIVDIDPTYDPRKALKELENICIYIEKRKKKRKRTVQNINDSSIGKTVEVISGPLKGIVGKISNITDEISVEFIIDIPQASFAVRIEKNNLKIM